MTKKYIAFFICLCILCTAFAQVLPPVLAAIGSDAQDDTEQTDGFVWPESKLTWMSYQDFYLASAVKAYENPELYLGYEAVFAVDYWGSFVLEDGFEKESRASQWPNKADLMDDEGNGLRVVITEYHLDTEGKALWYKVAAPEGETLPELLQAYPYVLFYSETEPQPAMYIQPQYAMFAGDTVEIKKDKVVACRSEILNTADLPLMFTVSAGWNDHDYYDLGDTTGWNAALAAVDYHYVDASSVILIPAEAAAAYAALMETRYSNQFYSLLAQIPASVLEQLSPQHYASLEAFVDELIVLENVQHTTEVQVGELTLPVTVKGRLPQEGVQLQAEPVTAETVLSEGFDIQSAEDIIVALDIKLINEADGSEWQPAEGESVEVSISVAEFGCEELQMVRVHHKHGDKIDVLDVFMVVDGAVTLETGGFSIYVVSRVGDTSTRGQQYDANSTITLTVGQEIFLYSGRDNTGTWEVTDTSGALYYTVHSNSTSLGNEGMSVPWIRIIALKEATNVKIQFKYSYTTGNYWNTQTVVATEDYTVNVVAPTAPAGKTTLYIKDDVNKTGKITAMLVDENGKEVKNGLDGAAFKWERSDGLFIVPAAYADNYQSVNIARDHAGLVENRKDEDGNYELVTYTLTATLADGTTPTATYTVYYQSEFINADFESPALGSSLSNYIMFPNGWEGVYWKTTAPGTGEKLTQDIEFGNLNGGSGTSFGVPQDADGRGGGDQFAELNAENVGALYQDIISVPGELIEWSFSHAPRQEQPDWAANLENKMYIIIGATEDAQKLTTQQDLKKLTDKLTAAQKNDADFRAGRKYYEVEDDNGATYLVWYHDAGTVREGNNNANNAYGEDKNFGWTEISGQYEVPEGQYRTRLFFVSDNTQANAGNLIDKAKAGQYKKYLIEYYEESFVEGKKVVQHIVGHDETGEALVYSSVPMKELDCFLKDQGDYLHEIMINGSNYPYDIRYAGQPSIYIEQYPGTAVDPLPKVGKDYKDYQIVVQVYVRDTVIAVKKELKLPGKMTEEQKLNLMNSLTANGGAGYQTYFDLTFLDIKSGEGKYVTVSDQTSITKRDPAGHFTGYVSIGNDENGDALSYDNVYYILTETGATELEGLILDSVKFTVTLYSYGQGEVVNLDTFVYEEITEGDPLVIDFTLTEQYKIAEILVENTYREKKTVIYYTGVGNGKVKFLGEDSDFEDIPTETLDFYSDSADGALPVAGEGASFVGWFKDPACTIPVTAKDGKIGDDGSFKPNANIISTEAVYFYAKFESGSVTINRTGGEPNQTFLYCVQEKNTGMIIYVSLTCDEEGKGSVLINEAPEGKYTVTELGDWSWRYPQPESQPKDLVFTAESRNVTFDFAGKHNEDQWLNGYSPVEENK